MKTSKMLSQLSKCQDLDIIIEIGGKKYTVTTAKKFRNPRREGPPFYFGIIVGKQITDFGVLGMSPLQQKAHTALGESL